MYFVVVDVMKYSEFISSYHCYQDLKEKLARKPEHRCMQSHIGIMHQFQGNTYIIILQLHCKL